MRNVFRDKALEQLSKPEQIDRLISVTSPRSWMALIGLTFIIISAIIWGFFGVVDIQVSGKGMLLSTGGIHDVFHPYEGTVESINVQVGETVSSGEVLAIIKRKDAAIGKIKETQIVAPISGRVVEVKVSSGDYLTPTTAILSIEGMSVGLKALDGFLYVPAEDGVRIQAGMNVFLSPGSTHKEDDGYLIGQVVSVTAYPVTSQYLHSLLENQEIVEVFLNDGPIVEVKVDLIESSRTVSGYDWTNKKGPVMKLRSGILCEGLVTIAEKKPIEIVFNKQ